MAEPPKKSIREVFLAVVNDQHAKLKGGSLQQISVLEAVANELVPYQGDIELEEAILTQWHDLFRTGLLAWGMNLHNPSPPFLHLTDRGRRALQNATRDPSNPDGYLRHLSSLPFTITSTAMSYLREALDCYVAGLYKASAVMVGAAAEATILELRDTVVSKLQSGQKTVPAQLKVGLIRFGGRFSYAV